jgi:uncharacterized protein (DUF58 family)
LGLAQARTRPGNQAWDLTYLAAMTRCFPGRGIIAVRGFRISSRFPFGFVERRRVVDANGEIVIYPKLKPLDKLASSAMRADPLAGDSGGALP